MSSSRKMQDDKDQGSIHSLGLFKINPMPEDLVADLVAFCAEHGAVEDEQDSEELFQLDTLKK